MNLSKVLVVALCCSAIFLTGCATIVGGAGYKAHIVVADKPSAKIIYKGQVVGVGSAVINVRRAQANNFTFSLREDSCKDRPYYFTSRKFRGWAFVGTVLLWTGTIQGIPVPWGVALDLSTGSIWKPDVKEPGVTQESIKTFKYLVYYDNCKTQIDGYQTPVYKEQKVIVASNLVDVVYLKNGNVVKGIIIEQIPNEHIKLQQTDGTYFICDFQDIVKIVKEQEK